MIPSSARAKGGDLPDDRGPSVHIIRVLWPILSSSITQSTRGASQSIPGTLSGRRNAEYSFQLYACASASPADLCTIGLSTEANVRGAYL